MTAARSTGHRTISDEEISARFRPLEPVQGALRQTAVAIAVAVAAFGARWVLDPFLADQHPYVMAFAAVAVATRLATWRAGLLCAVLSFLGADYSFVRPRFHYLLSVEELVGAMAFFALAALILYLAHRANRATSELRYLVQRLSQADARKSDFLAVLAHEVRGPLSAMRLASRVLMKTAVDPAQVRATETLERQIDQVARLTEDLMDASQIQAGKVQLHQVDVPAQAVLAQAMEAVRASTDARSQEIVVERAGDPWLHVDPARMVQILSNLLQNASKFSPNNARILVQLAPQGSLVTFRIKDAGVGIPPEKLEWVFDTYTQMEPHGDGLGLGLSLVRRLVELHGGKIRAHSRGAGEGSTFEVSMPSGVESREQEPTQVQAKPLFNWARPDEPVA